MPKYLVTGGAGFIGSHVVAALIERGDTVRIIDNLSTGKKENLHPKAEFIKADIRQLEEIKPLFTGFDGVFHLAALPRVQVSIVNPTETNDINITGTLNVLLAARDAGVKRLVYSASSSAYGDPVSLPLQEEMKPNPKSPYGLQKYVGEEYAKLANLFWNIETVSLRYFNVYGPRMASEGAYVTVIAIFNRQKMNHEPLTITGDGTQTRDFTFIGDIVRANILAMTSEKVGHGEVINIGNGDNHSVNEVAEIVGGETTHIPARVEPHDTLADNSKARELLDWQPKTSFAEGMKKTIAWYQEHAHESNNRE
ncbi:MAG: SDR family oxidoreductase [Patescibacteria group bacterium]